MKLKTNIGSVIFDSTLLIIGIGGILLSIYFLSSAGNVPYKILFVILSILLTIIGITELKKEFK